MTFIIGHRGARNLWAENSLTGFRNLLDLNVEGVEFDVHLTKDGELLVMHDALLDRTAEAQGPVSELSDGEHRQIRLKNSTDTIPTLDEVLAIYAETKLELHIELKKDAKGQAYQGLEAKAATAIDKFGLAERAYLTSFSVDVLKTIRDKAPHIRTLNSYHMPDAEAEGVVEGLKTRLAVADIVAVEKQLLGKYWDQITADAPLSRLGAWVPNEQADLEKWMNCGLRQITTDNPDTALAVRGSGKTV
ncbi:glycerophosphodiester phosphodiesterase family protein [Paenochrobactrum sp. BZR 588]|uniref:glycerophosphodiester phosphodiesterase family protein n=1 Tax=unclassified Paenochrobactrum TaxID=2639760 RepID=UPI0038525ECC